MPKVKIGLTIFRRWRAVHGAEEHPSPSGFAMVFQKAPFSPKGLNNGNAKQQQQQLQQQQSQQQQNQHTTNSRKAAAALVTTTPSKAVAAKNNKNAVRNLTTTSTLSYMVNIFEDILAVSSFFVVVGIVDFAFLFAALFRERAITYLFVA